MHAAVKEAVPSFQKKFEGFTTWMYLDVKGLVTTGIGNLIDPIGAAIGLPWVNPDGSKATQADIVRSWNAVKAAQDWKMKGGGAFKNLPGNDVRLTADGVDKLVGRVASSFDATLARRWPGYDKWPADGQLAALAIAWAYGPGGIKGLDAPLRRLVPDFRAAAKIADAALKREVARGNKGVEPRRIAVGRLFENAARVMKGHGNVEKLYWPSDAAKIGMGAATTVALAGAAAAAYYYRDDISRALKKGGIL